MICFLNSLSTGNHVVNGECVAKVQVGSYYLAFAISAFTTFYALPSIALVIFYGMIIYRLRRRVSEADTLGASAAVERASIQVVMLRTVNISLNLSPQ